jgi:hypothetical protein
MRLPTLVLRLEHALVLGRDATVARAVADIMVRQCFSPLKRVALETRTGRRMRYAKISSEVIREYLCDPQCDVVDMDSGRQDPLTAAARLDTGLFLTPSAWAAYPAPLEPHVIVPHAPELAAARIDAFCELAEVLGAVAGCVSVEDGFGMAQKLGIGLSFPSLERALQQPGMTERRLRERRTYSLRKVDRELPAPEWGLFLGPGHLERVSIEALEASGAFHHVRRLGEKQLFLRLTADPADALRSGYDELLEPVRRVLAPLLSPPIPDAVTP